MCTARRSQGTRGHCGGPAGKPHADQPPSSVISCNHRPQSAGKLLQPIPPSILGGWSLRIEKGAVYLSRCSACVVDVRATAAKHQGAQSMAMSYTCAGQEHPAGQPISIREEGGKDAGQPHWAGAQRGSAQATGPQQPAPGGGQVGHSKPVALLSLLCKSLQPRCLCAAVCTSWSSVGRC